MFPVVLVDTGAATNDLLELGHGADVRVENDQLAGLRINAGGHQLGGGGDDRISLGRIDEGVEVALSLFVVSRNLHDILAVG